MTITNAPKMLAALTIATAMAAPALAPAQDLKRMLTPPKSRQGQKNMWRNLGIAGGVVGVYGLFKGNTALTALGLGGGAYSAYRYEQDRKSQNREQRSRYELFRRKSFDYKGHRYVRRERWKNGKKSYYFAKVR